MRNDLPPTQYVGLARRAQIGALLRLGPDPLSAYWSCPARGVHAAGLGVAASASTPSGEVSWLGAPPPHSPPGPWFGGWAFDAERVWPGFANARWVLPSVLAWWAGDAAWIATFGPAGVTEAELVARLDAVTELEPQVATAGSVRRSAPEARTHWQGVVDGALAEIAAGRAEKIVCARVIELDREASFSERAVLKALEARQPQCWIFLVRGDDGRAFIGASPETLCETSGSSLQVDALAGTAAKGEGERLLTDDKERREHAAVVTGITATLQPWVERLDVPSSPSLKRLPNVEHLHTSIVGQLKPTTRPLDVARALHPTPAVAGTPTSHALAWLRAHEGFSRGWYCGAVGVFGPAGLTMAVGLRSALLSERSASVFVGAGVVKGSTAEREWVETERKARALFGALGVADE